MSQTQISLVVISSVLIGIFVLLPWLGRKFDTQLKRRRFSASHSLLLFCAIAILPLFALVEMSGRYGIVTLLALVIFGLLDMLSPIIMLPIQWLTNRHKISGITDILVYRFRGRRFGQLIAITLLITSLPLAMAHLLAATALLKLFFQLPDTGLTNLLIMLPLCSLLAIFVWPQKNFLDNSASQNLPLLFSSILIITSLVVVTFFIVQQVFGGITPMNQWVDANGQYEKLLRLENGPALIALFFCVNLVMPQFYQIRSKARSEKTIGLTAWVFPLLLLIASLPMFPLLWSGIELEAEIPLQMYAASLATLTGNYWLGLLSVIAGLTAALAGLALLLISLTRPCVNYLAMPKEPDFLNKSLFSWRIFNSRLAYCLLLSASVLGFSFVKSNSVTDLLLVSFTGLAQLAPGLIAAFYFPNINRKAVSIGLCAGLGFWFSSLLLPLFFGEWLISLSPHYSNLTLGVSNFSGLFYESLAVNICACMVVSQLTTMTDTEKHYANACMVDNLPEPQRDVLQDCSIDDFYQKLSQVLGPDIAADQISLLEAKLNIKRNENRPAVLRQFRDQLSANLNALVGTYASFVIMSQAFPVLRSKQVFNNLLTIEDLLDVTSNRLSGLSEKMNQLRIYHRRTLEKMPIGVCAIDEGGEIVFWNQMLERFTQIDSGQAQGCLIAQLPEPWRDAFANFLSSEESVKYTLEIPVNKNESQWCTLYQVSIETASKDGSSNKILLLEDVSEVVMLNRTLAHSERLASVGRLAAGVAHEIGNPVTGIACLAQDILSDDEDTQEIRKNAQMILQQTQRITDIVRSLTTFSRSNIKSTQEFQKVALLSPISEAITLLELRNDRQIKFVTQVSEDSTTLGDNHQLTQVFLNLLTNAYDASPEQGIVSIRAKPRGEIIEIEVIDQGSGIPDNIREMVFEPFFTTKDVGSGTGLGLSLVHDIISLHQGEISIINTETGNTMLIKLPRSFATVDLDSHNVASQ